MTQSKPDQMLALVERLRKAEGSEILPTVLLGMHNAETTCLHAADALTAALDENNRLRGALSASRETHCGIAEHILQGETNTKGIFADTQRARLAIDDALKGES